MRESVRPLLALDPAAVASLPPEALPGLLATLAALQTAVAARLAVLPPSPVPSEPDPGRNADRLLTVPQLAERVGRGKRWVYRRAHSWDFTVQDGKALMFSERGFERWIERNKLRNGH